MNMKLPKMKLKPVSLVGEWEAEVHVMEKNRDHRQCPKDWSVEDAQVAKLEAIYAKMSEADKGIIVKPRQPRGCRPEERSLIAHNNRGELIGFEDEPGEPTRYGGFSD